VSTVPGRGPAARAPSRVKGSAVWSFFIVGAGALLWTGLYIALPPVTQWLVFDAARFIRGSRLGESIAFFLYDVPKILLLLTAMIFTISVVRGFFSPERTRALLGGKRQGIGNVFAALLGIVTPFCSCSAVPLFIGFVEAGIPLGVTFSFLIAAPTINEVAVILLFGMFGWKVAGLYILSGLVIAIVAGLVIGKLHMERYVEDFVWKLQVAHSASEGTTPTWPTRLAEAWRNVGEIVGKVWPYVLVGIAVGAGIHGYVPAQSLASIMGRHAWWSVPAAVLIGIPLYSNAAGVIPIVGALIEKGASMGTVLAFMMGVVGLSLPETIILRRVLKPRLIAVFIGVVALAIILTGYLFNIIL
jgi:uncharacterized membrane protein YraQ (UPF0718 family)